MKNKKLNLTIVFIVLLTNTMYSQISNISELQIKYVALTVFDIDTTIVNNGVAESVKETKPLSYFLTILGSKAVYSKENSMVKETEDKQSLAIRRIISNDGYETISYNSDDKIVEKSKFLMGGTFCVKSRFDDEIWQISKESKMIDKYLCYKATLVKKTLDKKGNEIEKIITAYFSPELPISLGPLGYCGLPGLILELSDNSKTIRLVEIQAINKERFKFPNHDNCTKIFTSELALEQFIANERNN